MIQVFESRYILVIYLFDKYFPVLVAQNVSL